MADRNGTGEKKLDSPREKIAKIIFHNNHPEKSVQRDWALLTESQRRFYFHIADQIEPLIEEAKKKVVEDWNKELRITVFKAIKEGKKQGEKKALRRILRESKYLSPYELMSSIKQALGGK